MMRLRALFSICFSAALLLLPETGLFAQAKMGNFVGKVEVKLPKANWAPARKGMAIPPQSMIATGFRSKAEIELDRSRLRVNQLTRLKLEDLIRRQDEIVTNLYIDAGSLEADVDTKPAEYSHKFTVKSAVSTAAVRGTKIVYNGTEMAVTEGKAILYNFLKQPMTVYEGESARTGTGLDLVPSRMLRNIKFRIPQSLKRGGSKLGVGGDDGKYTSDDATIVIYTEW